ncbi:uncharacterized protein EV154DRAFT_567650 [Mucor mucedo]|uniref:uncharacterized protein n=1 Tax=Mucor mucedo TaxID=29922 RepID=UPI00222003C9|nr:uncharacterized protein EV154DRAFT_567650 [Mucor mucedo]KAI7886402.1 hypothetical protein EV154DRAFT_567650 [Mucor mucedo]
MNIILSLPIELLNNVLSRLDEATISRCALVCKAWELPARKLQYTTLQLHDWRIYLAKQNLAKRDGEQADYFKNCVHIKELVIADACVNKFRRHSIRDYRGYTVIEKCSFTKEEFLQLLEYASNVERINLSQTQFFENYLTYLHTTDLTNTLSRLQNISLTTNRVFTKELLDLYFSVCYKYRSSITELKLEHRHRVTVLNSQSDKTLTFLSHFPALTHLRLINFYDPKMEIFDLHQACSNLASLEFTSQNDFLDKMPDNFDHDKFHMTLKNLRLFVPTIPKNYLMHTYTQLDSLHMESLKLNLYDWVNEVGLDTALELVALLGTIRVVTLTFSDHIIKKKKELTSAYGSTFNTPKGSVQTVFFNLLAAFKGNHEPIYCRANYDSKKKDNSMSKNSDASLSYNFHLNDSKDSGYTCQSLPTASRYTKEAALFDNTSFAIQPDIVNSLSIRLYEYIFRFKSTYKNDVDQNIMISPSLNPDDWNMPSKNAFGNISDKMKVIQCVDYVPDMYGLSKIFPNIECCVVGASPLPQSDDAIYDSVDVTPLENMRTLYYRVRRRFPLYYYTMYERITVNYDDGDTAHFYLKEDRSVQDHEFIAYNPKVRYEYGSEISDFFEDYREDERIFKSYLTIECSKNTNIVFFYSSEDALVEIEKGKLLDYFTWNYNDYKNRVLMARKKDSRVSPQGGQNTMFSIYERSTPWGFTYLLTNSDLHDEGPISSKLRSAQPASRMLLSNHQKTAPTLKLGHLKYAPNEPASLSDEVSVADYED